MFPPLPTLLFELRRTGREGVTPSQPALTQYPAPPDLRPIVSSGSRLSPGWRPMNPASISRCYLTSDIRPPTSCPFCRRQWRRGAATRDALTGFHPC